MFCMNLQAVYVCSNGAVGLDCMGISPVTSNATQLVLPDNGNDRNGNDDNGNDDNGSAQAISTGNDDDEEPDFFGIWKFRYSW